MHSENNIFHGVSLKAIMEFLVAEYGWDELATRIPINCFLKAPSMNSTLKFLRKTDWARAKVENLYLLTKTRGQKV